MSDQHDNFERDLTDKLTHLAESAIPDGSSTTDRSVDIVRWREQPRRSWFGIAAAAAAVAFVVGLVVVADRRDDPGAVRTDYPPTPGTITSPPAATTTPTVESDADLEESARKGTEEEVEQAHEDRENRVVEERDRVRAANEQLIAERFAEIGVDYVPLAERRVAYLDPERYGSPDPIRESIIKWVNNSVRGEYMAVRDDGSTIMWNEAGPGSPEERGLVPLDVGTVIGADRLPVGIEIYRADVDGFQRVWIERGDLNLRSLTVTGPEALDHYLPWIVEVAGTPIESIVAPPGYQFLGRPTVTALQYSESQAMVELAQFERPIPEGVTPVPAFHTGVKAGDGFVESRESGLRAWRVDDHTLASIVIWGPTTEMLEELADATSVGAALDAEVNVRQEGFPATSADGISIGSAELVELVVDIAFDNEHVRFALAVSRDPSTGATCSGFLSTLGGSADCETTIERPAEEFCVSTMIDHVGQEPRRVLVLVDSERADEVAFGGEEVTTRLDNGTNGGHEWTMIEATLVGTESASTGVSVEVTVDGKQCGSSPESTSAAVGTVAPSPVGPTGPATTVVTTDPPS